MCGCMTSTKMVSLSELLTVPASLASIETMICDHNSSQFNKIFFFLCKFSQDGVPKLNLTWIAKL